jgi:hypothetical protein
MPLPCPGLPQWDSAMVSLPRDDVTGAWTLTSRRLRGPLFSVPAIVGQSHPSAQ